MQNVSVSSATVRTQRLKGLEFLISEYVCAVQVGAEFACSAGCIPAVLQLAAGSSPLERGVPVS